MKGLVRRLPPLSVALVLAACQPPSSDTLVLPEGDVAKGSELFVEFRCNACHSVRGVELPDPVAEREHHFVLGGQRTKAYAELVTSVINPSHRVAIGYRRAPLDTDDGSPMAVYNDVMTVTELVDLVAFLQAQYKVERKPRYRYVPYEYGTD